MKQRGVALVEQRGGIVAPGEAERTEQRHCVRHNVGGDGDNAPCAQCHHAHGVRVVPAPKDEAVAAECLAPCKLRQIARSLLYAVDVRVRRKCHIGLRRNANAGASGDVVDDHGYIHAVGDILKMADKPCLGRLVVIGRYHEYAVRSGIPRHAGVLQRGLRVV